mgnify:CR=1 FL=1
MALRKNNQKDYDKFNDPGTDVLGNKRDTDPPKVAGEYTGEIRKDKKGMDYSIAGEGDPDFELVSTVAKGDTILPSRAMRSGSYIAGGDYDLEETKSSKKRLSGPRTYKIKD